MWGDDYSIMIDKFTLQDFLLPTFGTLYRMTDNNYPKGQEQMG